MAKENFIEALKELRKDAEKRSFDQSVDLIINLKNFDPKRESVNLAMTMPNKGIDKKIGAFLEASSDVFDGVILKNEIDRWKEKKKAKELAKEYDFFVAAAPLMPLIATHFGKIFGPVGKMPDPKSGGVMMRYNEQDAKQLVERLRRTVRIKTKEASIKVVIGKESQKDEILAENAETIYNALLNSLTRKKENIKSVLIKFTMSKPAKVRI